MGILTGAVLPGGQTLSQAAGSLAAQCILEWGTKTEPQDTQLLNSLGRSSLPQSQPAQASLWGAGNFLFSGRKQLLF